MGLRWDELSRILIWDKSGKCSRRLTSFGRGPSCLGLQEGAWDPVGSIATPCKPVAHVNADQLHKVGSGPPQTEMRIHECQLEGLFAFLP